MKVLAIFGTKKKKEKSRIVSSTSMVGTIPSEFGRLNKLVSLVLNNNHIEGSALYTTLFCDFLEDIGVYFFIKFNFYFNSMVGSIPSQIGIN